MGGRAVVLGDETAGIGLVAHDLEALGAQQVFQKPVIGRAGGPVPVADHDVHDALVGR